MTLMYVIASGLAGFLVGFGEHGVGEWSPYLTIVGGFIWLGAIITAFVAHGLAYGMLAVLASFVVAAITMPLGRLAVTKLRGR